MDLIQTMKGMLASIGLATATSATPAPAAEPPQISPDQREALYRSQQIRLELSKIKPTYEEEAQAAKAKLGFSCSEEFRKVTDPVSGKIYAEPENKACAAFRPPEKKLSF